MVNYECYNCGYKSINKTHIKRHLSKKNICQKIRENIDLVECEEYILKGLSYNEYCVINDIKPDNNYCVYCKKIYKYASSLKRHEGSCKNNINKVKENNAIISINNNTTAYEFIDLLKTQIDNQKIQIQLQNEQLQELTKKLENNDNTEIIINSFNNTNLTFLTNEEIHSCLGNMSESYIKMLEKIHFNENIPENNNIYLSNIRLDTLRVYNGHLWTTIDKTHTIIEICNNITIIFDDYIDYCEENNKYPKLCARYNKYQNIITDEEKEYDKLCKKMENRIYDNSKYLKNKPP